MLPAEVVRELRDAWLPHVSDAGLDRVIDLIEKGSPLLLSGRFTEAVPQGCLATHIGWHHPAVAHRTLDAGILWLTRVARLNPATSAVIREWDRRRPSDWTFRSDLLEILKEERASRGSQFAGRSHSTNSELWTANREL
jgi:hypothetical protein